MFITWGYRGGDPGNYPGDTFTAMRRRVVEGYPEVRAELSAPVAPVGLAWEEALRRERGLDLWAGDGEHPNTAGSLQSPDGAESDSNRGRPGCDLAGLWAVIRLD